MKKIPTIFKRDINNLRKIVNVPHESCQWVFKGEGVATRKYDGACVKVEDGKYYKRREVKQGKNPPENFIKEDFDSITGKTVGWVEVDPLAKDNKYHMEAFNQYPKLENGTYELLGPKIQGNPEKLDRHILMLHSSAKKYFDVPLTFEGLRCWLNDKDIEGIVFHHPDGRMGKIKKRDFNLKRG